MRQYFEGSLSGEWVAEIMIGYLADEWEAH